jgi:hypothetical protein
MFELHVTTKENYDVVILTEEEADTIVGPVKKVLHPQLPPHLPH